MARNPKTPKFDEFNSNKLAFGRRAQDPKLIKDYFKSQKYIFELGCGKAELSMALAKKYPDKNFIGVDLKADRLWRPAKTAVKQKLKNIVFLQSDILELKDYFDSDSAEEIWITFPDPYPKKKQAKHRMLNKNFLSLYKYLLYQGKLKYKTDNLELFKWSLVTLVDYKKFTIDNLSFDLHSSNLNEDTKIMTSYEKRFVKEGLKINYLEGEFSQ